MDTIGDASGMMIDLMILVCLVVAISVGTVLLWQIVSLRRERFRFEQMTRALGSQMSIFQSALAAGKDDIEVKITRLNKILGQGEDVADELRILIEAAQNSKAGIPAQSNATPIRPRPQPQIAPRETQVMPNPEREERRPMFAIVDPEFMPDTKEDAEPAVDDFGDLSASDRAELAQLATHAERALMAALKRAGRR